ncbi:MAG TPA: hypothetical protein VGL93_18580 [Streptosporangiaceae bacterium]|jgi:hypothetical protein
MMGLRLLAGTKGKVAAAAIVVVVAAGGAWLVWRPDHAGGPCHGDYRTFRVDRAFADGVPRDRAVYAPPAPESGAGPAPARRVLAAARRYPGGPALGRLRWAASHGIITNGVGVAQMADGVFQYAPVALSGVLDGTVVVTAPMRDDDDQGASFGVRMGALRVSDGQVVWTCMHDDPANPDGGEQTPIAAAREAATSHRFAYRTGQRPGLTARDRRTGRTIRTAAFLPGAGERVMPSDNTGAGTQIAVGDGTLIAQVSNLTLAFDLPPGS